MKREDAIQYVGHHVDDALSPDPKPITEHTRLVGFQCGYEPMFVAVHSYLPECSCSDEEAIEIAEEYLEEIGWMDGMVKRADFIL